MNITVNKIIDKMFVELQMAKNVGNSAKVRDHLLALRTLCDLVLDEAPVEKPVIQQVVTTPMPSTNLPITAKLEEEDANGDSLFDF